MQLKFKKWLAQHEDITRYYVSDTTGVVCFGYVQESFDHLRYSDEPDRTFRVKQNVLNALVEHYGGEAELMDAIKDAADRRTVLDVKP